MKEKYIRLKDLTNISSVKIDYSIIMREVFGFKKKIVFNKVLFKRAFINSYNLVNKTLLIDLKECNYAECGVRKPSTIDNISFLAMIELLNYMQSYNDSIEFEKYIAKIISIVCYSSTFNGDYNSNNGKFKELYEKVLSQPLDKMIGLYNWIEKDLMDTQLNWKKRFLSVQVEDKDYEKAGGNRMSQFNTLQTIKTLCKDFNCTYKEAWQMSYSLSQTNSYEKASANYTQDQIRIIKELKMKSNREK